MITLRHENCPICGSGNRRLLGRPGKISHAFDQLLGEIAQVEVVRCMDCSGKYIHPMMYFSEEFLRKLYNVDYWDSSELHNLAEKTNILRVVQRLFDGFLRGKTLLDVGCGAGEYLLEASKLGMVVTGIDVEESITKQLRQKYGFNMVTGLLTRGVFSPSSFDVVVLSHVIEHLPQPVELLSIIYEILQPGGLFVMGTPNSDSLEEHLRNAYGRLRYDKTRCYYMAPFENPYHILGFNLESSRRILARTGFSPEYLKLHSGLEWEDKERKLVMRSIKVLGAVIGHGMSIVTISRKPAARA